MKIKVNMTLANYSTQVTGETTIDWKSLSNANDVDVEDTRKKMPLPKER